LRQQGSIVEVCVLDLFGEKRPAPKPQHIYALMQEDLVDTLGTDYAGGNWDGVLIGMQELVSDGAVTLPKAIRLATHNVARAIPGVGERGELAPGKLADIAIVNPDNVADVETVIISGRVAYRDGRVLFGESMGA
jgi:imidazolonepropionase-like amidohydrolase